METKRLKKPLPAFKDDEEAARFFDTHDPLEYLTGPLRPAPPRFHEDDPTPVRRPRAKAK